VLPWQEQLAASTLEEVLQSQVENREWSKEIRRRTSSLVDNRLANEIDRTEYLASRQLAREDTLECRRRAGIIEAQIRLRYSFGAGD
jgi:hypothetical protein